MFWTVEVTGWNSDGEPVEDSTDVPGADSDDAIDAALPKMITRTGIVEVGDVRATQGH